VSGPPVFRQGLYRGTAGDYDRFRPPNPQRLIDDLAARTGADGTGILLDLACGTGQLSLPLRGHFRRVLAVDAEPGMLAVLRRKALAAAAANVRLLACSATDLRLPPDSLDLVTIGNAFHRLPRQAVAAAAARWLRPGAHLALVWASTPTEGGQDEAPWRQAMATVMQRWMDRSGSRDLIPAGYEQDRRDHPDRAILEQAGFSYTGSWQFSIHHEWSIESLTGFAYSTSILSRAALGELAPAFEADLRAELTPHSDHGRFPQEIPFAYELARHPT
jgi:ubiquinone/menaquinone biosynthesis C-methylase UbiE